MKTNCQYTFRVYYVAVPLGGNVHRILLQNEPMFTLNWGKVRESGVSPIQFFFRYLTCVDLESLYVYLANCMHDLTSNTELDSENHKMKVVLTPKCRHLSQKRNNIEPRKQAIKILNRPIFCNDI